MSIETLLQGADAGEALSIPDASNFDSPSLTLRAAIGDISKSLMNAITLILYELQESTLMAWRAFRSLFTRPRYFREIINQMDLIGVGSLVIVLLTGFFTGAVLALQTGTTMASLGAKGFTGRLVATSLVRELGPVLTSLMVAGRVGSGIAAELGSMLVSDQIDAMRALGTDPIRKLVMPRMVALLVMVPALTVISIIVGTGGGLVVAISLLGLPYAQYISSAKEAFKLNDLIGSLIKALIFGFIIAVVGCRSGLKTRGGTVGVGRSTTQSVVVASILILVADFFITRALQIFLPPGQ
ncbi:MAG: ABC transporter permease [Acidobacteriota bacterium]|nr:ABC transporter permease [Acidobacteriota bacterium]MDW8255782.1 ABC transporter permease [Acidobacteriota bacterium]